MMMFTPLQIGIPGGMELAVILLIAVLLFGANKIPKLARSTGQAMGEFQRGRTEIEQELENMKQPMDTSSGTGAASSTADTPVQSTDEEDEERESVETASTDTDETK